ncbi:hypothetical protein [Streptomyces sp. NPDC091259]|uniref:aromatic-ring hydroxylase C-terminal domain-containing protein n=1 Tax=Streptomyces sp. NPDC091259 TaxID=3365976 RepID=UPI003808181E
MAGPLPGGITRIIVCERGTPPRRREGPPPFEELLIRPDGYVAWAAPGGHHDLPTTLERRFGTP